MSRDTWETEWDLVDGSATLRGGQATVAKVRRRADQTFGALKVLHSEHLKNTERRFRMQQEANALIALNGQGVPRLLASNVSNWAKKGEALFIVMEWIEGPTLAEICSRGPVQLDQAMRVVDKMLDTIALCHGLDIHHRDLKPDNVILRSASFDAPVLVDFGMTWTRPLDQTGTDLATPMGQEIGNRFLRLPEYAPGQNVHDPRSDVSMAVGLLFFMLTAKAPRQLHDAEGRLPHETSASLFAEDIRQDVRWPRLQRIFNIGFQPSFDLRFQTVGALKERLSNLVPPSGDDVQADLQEELAKIHDILSSAQAQAAETIKTKIQEGLHRFLRRVQEAVKGSQFVFGGHGPSVLRGGTAGDLNFFMVQTGTSEPQARFHHLIVADNGMFKASVQVEASGLNVFYSGPIADADSLYEAVEAHAPIVAKLLLQAMGTKLRDQLRT
jgi:serine/threonine protein kinase